MHTPNIHTLCGIQTLDPGFRASEDSTCLRLLGYRDRPKLCIYIILWKSHEIRSHHLQEQSSIKLQAGISGECLTGHELVILIILVWFERT
jgi:hypothetical protein